jgi:hypothetical protein
VNGQWFESYLLNRAQVKIIFQSQQHKSSSKWGKVKCGVSQGSSLGLLLFTIYINDLPPGIKGIKLWGNSTDSRSLYVTKENFGNYDRD